MIIDLTVGINNLRLLYIIEENKKIKIVNKYWYVWSLDYNLLAATHITSYYDLFWWHVCTCFTVITLKSPPLNKNFRKKFNRERYVSKEMRRGSYGKAIYNIWMKWQLARYIRVQWHILGNGFWSLNYSFEIFVDYIRFWKIKYFLRVLITIGR